MASGMGRGAATSTRGGRLIVTAMLLILAALGGGAGAQENAPEKVVDLPGGGAMVSGQGTKGAVKPAASASPSVSLSQLPDLSKRENLSSALQLVIPLTVLS